MTIEKQWKEYLKNWRQVSFSKFYKFLKEYWDLEKAKPFLDAEPKNWRLWMTKVKNPKEVVDFAKINSPKKAAKEYNISERQVYRYIKKYK